MTAIDSPASGASTARQNPARGAVIAGTFCSVFEWFDLMLGAAMAGVLFPPQATPGVTRLLFAFAPVVARLLGAVALGGYGDRVGRKAALLVTLLMMSTASLLLGLMVAQGFGDVIVVLVLRIVQGAAVGAAWAGCVCLPFEWADPDAKGRFAAWPQIGVPAGFALAQITFFFLSTSSWLACLVAGAVGLFAAVVTWGNTADSPAFIDRARAADAASPLMASIRHDYPEILLVALVRAVEIVAFIVFTSLIFAHPALRQTLANVPAAILVSTACLVAVVFIPIFGHVSDRIGRTAAYVIGALAMGVWAFAYVALLNTAVAALMLGAIAVSLLPYAMMVGAQAALIAESFTTPRRYSGTSLGTQLGAVIAGIAAPMVVQWLLTRFPSGYAIAIFVLGCSYVSVFAALALRRREIVHELVSNLEFAIQRTNIKDILLHLPARLGIDVAMSAMLRNTLARSDLDGWIKLIFDGGTRAARREITAAAESQKPGHPVPKRSLNAWIDDPAPMAGRPFQVSINIGKPAGGEVASEAFVELDWQGVESINLIVTLSSINCSIEPAWHELTLLRSGDSEMISFAVTAGVDGSHDFTVRVYLAKQLIRLQSLRFTVAVAARQLQPAGAA